MDHPDDTPAAFILLPSLFGYRYHGRSTLYLYLHIACGRLNYVALSFSFLCCNVISDTDKYILKITESSV
jgi:hypothetical protein